MASNGSNETAGDIREWNMSFHTVLLVLAFVIVLVNIPVVVLYFKISSLRHSAGNTFLVGLAVSDILCACVAIPTGITCDVGVLEDKHHVNMCIMFYVCSLTLSVGSIYLIVAATIAKYFAIVHPMRNITACTKARVNFVVVAIWITAFLVGHVPFYLLDMEENKMEEFMHKHTIFLIVFAFAIPALILTYIHVHIFLRLFLNSRPRALITDTNTRRDNNRRIAILFSMLFLFFVVSWLPSYLIWSSFIIETEPEVEIGITLLRYAAPIFNPLMFTFAKRDFRKAAISLVSGIRGKPREFSSRRCNTQATSSVDRANFVEQLNVETTSKVDPPEDTTINEPEQLQII